MARTYQYDCLVVGGGAAGLTAAKMAHEMGKHVAIVEKHRLGGDCTLTGCVPSKALIKSARVAYMLQHLRQYGIRTNASFTFKGEYVFKHVRATVRDVYNTHAPEKLIDDGIDVIYGHAVCASPHTLDVDGTSITAARIILATGSDPIVPPIEGLDEVPYLTNESLYTLEYLPTSLVVLGAGPIGLEMASAFNRLGTNVTVVEMQDRILSKEDAEMAAQAEAYLCYEGVTILKQHTAQRVETYEGKKHLIVDTPDGQQKAVSGSELLIAIGQKPNVSDLGLDDVGITYDKTGVRVNAYLQTDVTSIYACGDIVGPYQFSHVAYYQAQVATRNAFVPIFKQRVSYEHIPWITYITPELATSGMTEQQARDKYGDNIRIYRAWYQHIDRAFMENERRGYAKYVCDMSGNILGVHILGAHAGEVLHEVHAAKHHGIKLQDLFGVVHAYPAYSDVVWDAAKQAYIDNLKRSWWYRLYSWATGA